MCKSLLIPKQQENKTGEAAKNNNQKSQETQIPVS